MGFYLYEQVLKKGESSLYSIYYSARAEEELWEKYFSNWNCQAQPLRMGWGRGFYKVECLWLLNYGLFNIIELFFFFSVNFPFKMGIFYVHLTLNANIHVYWCWLVLGRIWPDSISSGRFFWIQVNKQKKVHTAFWQQNTFKTAPIKQTKSIPKPQTKTVTMISSVWLPFWQIMSSCWRKRNIIHTELSWVQ